MEVILILPLKLLIQISILHVCGGDPQVTDYGTKFAAYSPRMWRWSYGTSQQKIAEGVFSTYVEVILSFESAIKSS